MYATRKSQSQLSLVDYSIVTQLLDLGTCAPLPSHFPIQLTLLYISGLLPAPPLLNANGGLLVIPSPAVALKLCQRGVFHSHFL